MLNTHLKSLRHAEPDSASHKTLNQVLGDGLLMTYKLIARIIAVLLLPGCAVRSVFAPASQNIMLFDVNKQIKANAYVSTGKELAPQRYLQCRSVIWIYQIQE